jgi:7SK snRNA methylphosphate capping enzyme
MLQWFAGKTCLDLGCNAGVLTILIADELNCQHIVGADVDAKLVKQVNHHVHAYTHTHLLS